MPNVVVGLESVFCAHCGLLFGITEDYERRRRNDHAGFFCPAGHSNVFHAKSEADKLRDQVAAMQGRLDQSQAALEAARKETRAAEKRAKTNEAKHRATLHRVDNGVCPHCSRSFQNLARHVKTKHPEALAGKGA